MNERASDFARMCELYKWLTLQRSPSTEIINAVKSVKAHAYAARLQKANAIIKLWAQECRSALFACLGNTPQNVKLCLCKIKFANCMRKNPYFLFRVTHDQYIFNSLNITKKPPSRAPCGDAWWIPKRKLHIYKRER